MQLKDAQFNKSWNGDIYIYQCPNVRMIGDVIALAGSLDSGTTLPHIGVYFSGDDLTLSNGVIEESDGIGLDLNTALQVSVTGMFFSDNGKQTSGGGAGIEIDGSQHVSVTGSKFAENDGNTNAGAYPAQVRFGGSLSNDVEFSGNVYEPDSVSQYVYDVTTGAQTVTNAGLFEAPVIQKYGVFSPNAVSYLLPYVEFSPGFANNYITGLTLSNDGSSTSTVDFAPGQAADSTNTAIMTLPAAGCKVNLAGPTGVNALDTGTVGPNKTYFYFLIAPAGGGGGTSAFPSITGPSCIASASLAPTLTGTGYSLFRMVGALYTGNTISSPVVPFVQSDDTFTLGTTASFQTTTLGTSSMAITIGSVPSQISVEAFGRCESNAAVTLSAGNVTAQTPNTTFATSPGYMITSPVNPHTSFPFALYTVGGTGTPPLAPSGTINAAAAAGTTTLDCQNDGWIWHRGR
jgi:hypothetical protein